MVERGSLLSSSSIETREDETPRNSMDFYDRLVTWIPPASPSAARKTRSRAARMIPRTDSLRESKVLMVTDMRRTDSITEPELFHYHDHFEFLSLIGETKTSQVFRVRHRITGEVFAVKRSRKRFRSKLQRERCLREIKAVAALPGHENIVSQYRAWQEGGHFYIQMDYCEGGSLHQYLYGPKSKRTLSDEELWKVALNIAQGLDFLHMHNTLHLDIKPENLYCDQGVDGPGQWKIGDFGLAVAKESKDWEEGDGDYVAPELLRSGCDPSPAADVFSLGAALYECATGHKLPRKKRSPDADLPLLDGRQVEFQTLLAAMTLPEPRERPLASQVANYARFMLKRENNNSNKTKNEKTPNNSKCSSQKIPSLSPVHSDTDEQVQSDASGLLGLTPLAEKENTEATAAKKEEKKRSKNVRLPLLAIPQSTVVSNANTARTSETSNSFRIKDFTWSPGRECLASDSDVYSFSCGDNGSLSELEFADVMSPRSARAYPSSLTNRFHEPCSLLTEFNTSPEFVHSSHASPSGLKMGYLNLKTQTEFHEPEDSLQARSAPASARSHGSIPKFPTLEEKTSIHSAREIRTCNKLRNNGKSDYKSPFESDSLVNSSKKNATSERVAVPALKIPQQNFGRKRQLSSRRLLLNSFREGDATGRSLDLNTSRSVESFMPHKKEARYGDKDDSSGNSTERKQTGKVHCPVAAAAQMDTMSLHDTADA